MYSLLYTASTIVSLHIVCIDCKLEVGGGDDSQRERPDVVVEICHLVNRPRFRYQLLSRYQRTATVNILHFVLLSSSVAVENFLLFYVL